MSRSKWKGPSFKDNKLTHNNKIQELKRNSEIIPQFVGRSIKTYNGKKFIKITLTEDMIGHKIGEFSPTRARFEFKKKKKK